MLSESDTFTLLIALIVGALFVIGWALVTLDKDGPEPDNFSRQPRDGSSR